MNLLIDNWIPIQHQGVFKQISLKELLTQNEPWQVSLPRDDMDILKYGADAEILSPPELRAQVAEKVKNLQAIYEKDVTPSRDGGVGVVE